VGQHIPHGWWARRWDGGQEQPQQRGEGGCSISVATAARSHDAIEGVCQACGIPLCKALKVRLRCLAAVIICRSIIQEGLTNRSFEQNSTQAPGIQSDGGTQAAGSPGAGRTSRLQLERMPVART